MVRKTKEEAQETRNALLDAAEEVFHRQGVTRTSLAEVAAVAGVTRGAVYWHFENKAALFDAMMQRVFVPLEEKLAELQATEAGNPLDILRTMARYFLAQVATDARTRRVLEIAWHKCEYVGEMAATVDQYLECGNRYLVAHEAAIRLALERGFLPASVDPHGAAVGFMALLDGLIVNWTVDVQLFDLARVGPAVVDAYLAGLTDGAAKLSAPTR